uniref:Holin n=2 Tax=unclassified bacterial viruses TaxID=12333 RepID=A0AAU7J7I5_9VIRU
MYSGLPVRERRAVKSALIVGWLSSVGAGVSALTVPTSITLIEMGLFFSILMGVILVASASAATYGVASGRYRFEWVAAWIAAAGFVPFWVTLWSLTITLNPSWLTAAFVSTISMSFFVSRAFLCGAHAAKLRIVHTVSETITSAIDSAKDGGIEGDGSSAQ